MKKLVTVFLILVCISFAGPGMLEPLTTLNGPIQGFGKAVLGGVDINGGGIPDVIVGSYFDGPGLEGMVYVYYGEGFDNVADLIFKGENIFDFFGDALSFCPDVNGDGFPELLIGARLYAGIGKVYLYYGGPSIDTTADLTFQCPTGNGEQFGFSIAAGYCTNGFWQPDIAIGAPYYNDGTNFIGRVYLFVDVGVAGAVDTLIFAGESGTGDELFGAAVATGRMDGDLDIWEEMLVGAPYANTYGGKAYLFWAAPTMDTIPDLTWQGVPVSSEILGSSVASISDLNHDGLQDFAIGIPSRNNGRGVVYIILGKWPQDTTPDYVLNGDFDYGYFGCSINTVGDVNGDTYRDLMIGAKNYDNGKGRVFLYLAEFDTIYDGYADAPAAEFYNNFGISVFGCGDLDGDGFGDMVVGSDGAWGRAYIYKGRDEFVPPVLDSVTQLNDTGFCGPFIVSAYIWDLSGISKDSIYYNVNGTGYVSLGHDSVQGNTYFFNIPQQPLPAYVPTVIQWYLMARDSSYPNANVTYAPPQGAGAPYSFQILDLAGPAITNTTKVPDDTIYAGPFPITCSVTDQSGVALVRLRYWESPEQENFLPMFPTGVPNEYYASIPVQNYGRIIAYRVEALDSFVIPNTGYDPSDYPTCYAFCIGTMPQILLVDNDNGDSVETYYKTALDSLGVAHMYWPDCWGKPRYAFENNFPILLWFTAQSSSKILIQEDMDSLVSFFNKPYRRLFISSQNLGEDIGSTPFYQNWLHAQFDTGYVQQLQAIATPGDSVSDIYKDTISIGGLNGANNADSKDRIFPLADADSVYRYRNIGGSAAIKYKDPTTGYRLVYFAFPFEAINGSASLFAQRTPIMESILKWFGIEPGITEKKPVQTVLKFALQPTIPNPFRSRANIIYTVPVQEFISLKVYDLTGRLVKNITEGIVEPGVYNTSWDGKDMNNRSVPSGIYFLILENSQERLKQKAVLLR